MYKSGAVNEKANALSRITNKLIYYLPCILLNSKAKLISFNALTTWENNDPNGKNPIASDTDHDILK